MKLAARVADEIAYFVGGAPGTYAAAEEGFRRGVESADELLNAEFKACQAAGHFDEMLPLIRVANKLRAMLDEEEGA